MIQLVFLDYFLTHCILFFLLKVILRSLDSGHNSRRPSIFILFNDIGKYFILSYKFNSDSISIWINHESLNYHMTSWPRVNIFSNISALLLLGLLGFISYDYDAILIFRILHVMVKERAYVPSPCSVNTSQIPLHMIMVINIFIQNSNLIFIHNHYYFFLKWITFSLFIKTLTDSIIPKIIKTIFERIF